MKQWWRAALIRAIRTWAQGFIALVPTTAIVIKDVNWMVCLSGASLAAVLSLITSIAGLPELDTVPEIEREDDDRSDEAPDYGEDDPNA